MQRTRVKICGITRTVDLKSAIGVGADALGFVFYAASPRYVTPEAARRLTKEVPAFVCRVGLFVNAEPSYVLEVLNTAHVDLLQFHGDEDAAYCEQFGYPYIKAARIRPELDLLEFANAYPSAKGLLLDAWVEGYGGAGQCFDWNLIPESLPLPVVLSGGLHAGNVTEAVIKTRPWAVDVSSGVEITKGVKDAEKIAAFVAAVREADDR